MKNLYFIFLISQLFYSCDELKEESVDEEIYTQDFLKYKDENQLELIDLDSLENFSELITLMEKVDCDKKVSGLTFKTQGINYNLTGFSGCPNSNVVACYFGVKTIIIKNDSIVVDSGNRNEKISIENLEKILVDIISKPYNYQYDKEHIKPALIYLNIDNKYPISTTKKVFKEIVEQFQRINILYKTDFFKFTILLKRYDISRIPPPPPPPNQIMDE